MLGHLRDLQVLSLQKDRNQVINLLARDHRWVHKEELKVDRCKTIFEDKEVAVGIEQLGDLKSLQSVDEAILELDVDCRGELGQLTALRHAGNVLARLQVEVPARTACIHHHLIELLGGVRASKVDRLMLKILWIGSSFGFLLAGCCCRLLGGLLLGTIAIISMVSSTALFALARLKTSMLNLLMLQDMHEYDASHVSVVGGLVIVRQGTLTLVLRTLVLDVKFAAQVTLKLVILRALVVHLAKRCLVKGF